LCFVAGSRVVDAFKEIDAKRPANVSVAPRVPLLDIGAIEWMGELDLPPKSMFFEEHFSMCLCSSA
ncbi:hypothetical protein HGRIS_001074, partial [Hohenbuehelia grisea]